MEQHVDAATEKTSNPAVSCTTVGAWMNSKLLGCRLWVPETTRFRSVLEGTHARHILHPTQNSRFASNRSKLSPWDMAPLRFCRLTQHSITAWWARPTNFPPGNSYGVFKRTLRRRIIKVISDHSLSSWTWNHLHFYISICTIGDPHELTWYQFATNFPSRRIPLRHALMSGWFTLSTHRAHNPAQTPRHGVLTITSLCHNRKRKCPMHSLHAVTDEDGHSLWKT